MEVVLLVEEKALIGSSVLSDLGLVEKPVEGDGNCQFRSLAVLTQNRLLLMAVLLRVISATANKHMYPTSVTKCLSKSCSIQ